MLRCGFGLKDAPRLWNKILRQVLSELGMTPLQSDPQLFVWHLDSAQDSSGDASLFGPAADRLRGKGLQVRKSGGESSHTGSGPGGQASGKASKRLVLILSTHVDDFKGAGESHYRHGLINCLEKAFSTLKSRQGVLSVSE